METLSPLTVALQKCIAAERATIVSFIRRHAIDWTPAALAAAIETGAHLRDYDAVTLSERTEHHGSNRHAANPAPR